MEQDATNITAISLIFTICLGLFLILLPRRYAIVPLFISGCYMTLGQVILIEELHFTILRILIAIGLVRTIIKKEIHLIKLNSIDIIVIAWILTSCFLYVSVHGPLIAYANRAGQAYNILGSYFLYRAFILNRKEVIHSVRLLAITIIPLAFFFTYEMETGKNLFAIFGGVPELSEIRDSKIRCQGAFRHPILAGTFGATSFPLIVGLWMCMVRSRYLIACAILVTAVIVITSASSGAFIAYLAGMVGLLCWHLKSHMRVIRWGIVVLVFSLTVFMKAPIWYLFARMSDIVGGSGWYRSALIDAAITHFDEWWLVGTTYTAHWMPTGLAADPTMADITNQFVMEGINGGILALCFFTYLIVKCFKVLSNALDNRNTFPITEKFMIWSIGCSLLTHIVSMFSVSYFDQINLFWSLIISTIAVYNPKIVGNVETKKLGLNHLKLSPPLARLRTKIGQPIRSIFST